MPADNIKPVLPVQCFYFGLFASWQALLKLPGNNYREIKTALSVVRN